MKKRIITAFIVTAAMTCAAALNCLADDVTYIGETALEYYGSEEVSQEEENIPTSPSVAPPSFEVKGIFGGKNVTFNAKDKDAVIYYTTKNRSALKLSDPCVLPGETVTFNAYYGTVYARTYLNGKWSNPARLILKIPVVNTPTITKLSNGKYKIKTTTPGTIIYYTTDGTEPSADNYAGKFWTSHDIKLHSGVTVGIKAVRSCFSDSETTSVFIEAADHYEEPFPVPVLTGSVKEDFLAVASSQVGYLEAKDGSSYFGAWTGHPYAAWCSEFVAWCAYIAKVPSYVIPAGRSYDDYRDHYASQGRYYYLEGAIDGSKTTFMRDYINIATIGFDDMEPGDLVLTESDGNIDNGPDHTAIYIGNGMAISGNSNNSVNMHKLYKEKIHGVCKPDYS